MQIDVRVDKAVAALAIPRTPSECGRRVRQALGSDPPCSAAARQRRLVQFAPLLSQIRWKAAGHAGAPACGRRFSGNGRHASARRFQRRSAAGVDAKRKHRYGEKSVKTRSEEHTSELQSLMRISYAVFCLKKQNQSITYRTTRK